MSYLYYNLKNNRIKSYLYCDNCKFKYIIKNKTIFYETITSSNQNDIIDDIDFIIDNPILPNSKDYICQNKKCETFNKNFDISKKKAVIYRKNNTFTTKYICAICKYIWTPLNK
jgi:DNA-directed RNA polymerase subunit RPC12/RpoP